MINKKLVSKSKSTSLKRLLSFVFAAVILGAMFWLWRSQVTTPEIALISNSNSSESCRSNVASLSLSQECLTGTYTSATFTCSDGTKHTLGNINSCSVTADSLASVARRECGSTCSTPVPSPSPTPRPSSATPTPFPSAPPKTPVPSPSAVPAKPISCNVEIFNVPRTESGNTSGGSGLGYFKPEYLVTDHNTLTIKPGDRLAYRATLINDNSMSVGDTYTLRSTNYNGTAEPVARVLAMGGACSTASSEYPNTVNCQAHASINQNSYSVINASVVLEYKSGSKQDQLVGTTFTGKFGTKDINCPMKPIKYSVSTRPTPTPLPSAPAGCYYQERACIQGFLGGNCTPRLVCPPSPKPTSSPASSTTPISRPPFAQCYRECRQAGGNFFACVRSCMR